MLPSFFAISQQEGPLIVQDEFLAQKRWVDSVYNKMTLKEKVGQLFMVDAFSSDSKKKTDKIKKLIEEFHIGGVIFSKGGPQRQAILTNEFQELSKVPLMISNGCRVGVAMRLDSTHAFPWNMTLGAIQDNKLIEETGKAIAKHCKRLGVHINFAPVVDINTNPINPIIGNRSFGEEKKECDRKSIGFHERNAKQKEFFRVLSISQVMAIRIVILIKHYLQLILKKKELEK